MDSSSENDTMTRASIHLVVYAKDLSVMSEFYQQALGLGCLERSDSLVVLAGEQFELSVVQIRADIAEGITLASPAEASEETPLKFSFLVRDIESVREPVLALGGRLHGQDAGWSWRGYRHLDGIDPEGNVFQLRQAQ